ncbi:helix-turn-helix domain-containing protein [Halovivax limisalsi]|uniref:helix-turn-helix domain-containing protein n=1 Tax=Halovivax limisalsi TaxID=1453760 RepID=UPI001FFC6455|nr:helix-turn-helix domain-containing protein [Halovivax limisalsi]
MAIIVEFTLPASSFPFGRSTSGGEGNRVQLERVIPLQDGRIPFLRVTGDDVDQFERVLRNSEVTEHVEVLTSAGDSVLYYAEWDEDAEPFLDGLAETGGTIMEAHGDAAWSFTVRFGNHAELTQFHRFYQDEHFPVHIERVAPLDDEIGVEYGFGLTPDQRETLIMAVENGYFSVPRGTKLDEIADELEITRQAASERVRRGTETVLRQALTGLAPTDEPSP